MSAGSPVLRWLPALERALERKGFPLMSAWWRRAIEDFYTSGKRQLVLRVGRRGGKSTSLSRVLVLEALYGDHEIPPGDIGVVAIVSISKKEARDRLRTISKILSALQIQTRPIDDGLLVPALSRAFRVYPASIGGVSGFTCIGALCDEVAKWYDADLGVNPATEVLASLRPTMAGHPRAKIFLASSPVGLLDAHAKAFALGDTDHQMVLTAPTWIARPTLTEEETHAHEPNLDVWRREYGCVPIEGSEEGLLSPALLDRATRDGPLELAPDPRLTYVAAQDPGFSGNAWTLVVAAQTSAEKKSIVLARQWRGSATAPLDPLLVLSQIATVLEPYRVRVLYSDQYEQFSLGRLARECGLILAVQHLAGAARVKAWEALVTAFAHRAIEIPADPVLRADFLAVRRNLTPAGLTIQLPVDANGRHADYMPAVLLAWLNAAAPPASEAPDLTTAIVRAELARAKANRLDWWDRKAERKKVAHRTYLR